MFKNIIITLSILSFSYSALYSVGDIISLSHQNQPFDVCYGDHPEDDFRLAHFNGDQNGGVYKVMFIDISATWCGPCVQFIPDFDAIDNYWLDNDGVAVFNALGDLNQPYTCTQWGNMGIPNIPMIAHDAQNNIFNWFNTGSAIPSTVFIDHEMRVHYMANQVSYSQANNIIQTMLDDCPLCGNPDYDSDFVLNENDNCPNDSNPGQEDQDLDNIGDACDDCHNLSGDPNDDLFVTVTDIILVVSMISNGGFDSESHSDCEKADGNFNNDSVINVLDIIQMINIILGNTFNNMSVSEERNTVDLDILETNDKLILKFYSENEIYGFQINANFINTKSKLIESTQKEFISNDNVILSYSADNIPFTNNFTIEIQKTNTLLNSNALDIVVSNQFGKSMILNRSKNNKLNDHGSLSNLNFKLDKTFPSPFNPVTNISFTIPEDNFIKLEAYDIKGQNIETIYQGFKSKGNHMKSWDASKHTSGIYFIRLISGELQTTTQTILMK